MRNSAPILSPKRKGSPKPPDAVVTWTVFAFIQEHRRQQRDVMAGCAIDRHPVTPPTEGRAYSATEVTLKATATARMVTHHKTP
jgi:hypothetical protein